MSALNEAGRKPNVTWNRTAYYPRSSLGRRVPDLALQQWLGLLPGRRSRYDPGHRADLAAARPYLATLTGSGETGLRKRACSFFAVPLRTRSVVRGRQEPNRSVGIVE